MSLFGNNLPPCPPERFSRDACVEQSVDQALRERWVSDGQEIVVPVAASSTVTIRRPYQRIRNSGCVSVEVSYQGNSESITLRPGETLHWNAADVDITNDDAIDAEVTTELGIFKDSEKEFRPAQIQTDLVGDYTIDDTGTLFAANCDRLSVAIKNTGSTNTVYLNGVAGVATGFPIDPGETITLDGVTGRIGLTADTGLSSTVRILELVRS